LSAAPYLCESFPGCLGPCHGGFAECTCLFLPPRHRPSPVHYRGRLPACTRRNDFMTDPFFETAAISLCSGPQMCLPPRSFLPLRLIAAGQPRLLRPSRTCVVASACIGYANHPPRQLVVWGLAPHEIHSLVGCSSAMGIFHQSRLLRGRQRRVVALVVLFLPHKCAMLEKELSFAGGVVHDCFDDLIFLKYVVVPIYITVCQLLL
jgi:hypothetical protein